MVNKIISVCPAVVPQTGAKAVADDLERIVKSNMNSKSKLQFVIYRLRKKDNTFIRVLTISRQKDNKPICKNLKIGLLLSKILKILIK